MALSAVIAVFSRCQNGSSAHLEFFTGIMAALLIGWFLAALTDGRYRKTVLALSMFSVLVSFAGEQIYGAAAASAVFIAVPAGFLVKFWCVAEERLMPESASDFDLKLRLVKGDLMKKRQAFSALAKLYGEGMESRQIISYQFAGLARTVERMICDLGGKGDISRKQELPPIPIGAASYAFSAVSGDSCLSFSLGKNKQAMMISDGMGKGSRAAAESRLVVETMSELLKAGFDVDLAMKTVNAILMTGNCTDMFATLDLAVIHKDTGRAHIFKMGAASTFVKHDGKVSMLKKPALPAGILSGMLDLAVIHKDTGRAHIFKMGAASTFVKHDGKVSMLKKPALPAGILSGMKLEYIDVKLHKGDILVMVSDGITDCDRNDPGCLWLRKRLLEIGSRDPETVAELIVNKAAEKYGIRERDDLTVMVAAL